MLDFRSLGLSQPYTSRLVTVGLVREPGLPATRRRIRSSVDVYQDFKVLSDLDREVFVLLHLDGKHRVAGVHIVSVGCASNTPVHPREVFKAAILTNATAVIALHNHPSGDPSPSREDRDITDRVKQVGELLGIPLIDHIVVGAEGFYSFADRGWTP